MANIKLPILVDNDKLEPMSDYIKITIEKCNGLPEKTEDNDISLMAQINKIFLQQDHDSEKHDTNDENEKAQENTSHDTTLFVLLDEIQNQRPKKTRQNISLKNKINKSKSISNYTMKNRPMNHVNSNT